MKLYKKMNIQTQFFLTYISIAFMIIFLFSVFFYHYISKILIHRETANFENLTNSFMEQIDSALHTMDDVSLNISYSNLVLSKLNHFLTSTEGGTDDFSQLVELFVALNGADYKVAQINVIGNSGRVITVGPYTNTSIIDLNSFDWIQQNKMQKGYKVLSLPYQSSKMLNNSSVSLSYLSLYRNLHDSYGRQIGYIETVQTCKKVFKSILSHKNSTKNGMKFYVYNQEGSLIYPYDPEVISTENKDTYEHYYAVGSSLDNSHILENPISGEKELITCVSSPYSGWTYVCAQEESIIIAPVKVFSNVLILVVLLVAALVLFFSYLMSKSLTSPIHQLLKAFHKTKIDTLGYVKKASLQTSFNEFDELNDAFYQMSSDLRLSLDALIETRQQELKSRSLALQSQINPHFYYNSLSSITVLAENGQVNEVIQFSRNLTSMMRYITHGNMQIVTLSAELTYVQKYMYCMKVRYQSSLNYIIDVDNSLYDIELPKLLIQPLVENALKYGINCEPPWEIQVISEITNDYWLIHVSDSGPGFTKEAMEQITERFQQADSKVGMPETKIDGLGMLNVYQRWKLYCKENYIFKFSNKPDGGSLVSIGKYIGGKNE